MGGGRSKVLNTCSGCHAPDTMESYARKFPLALLPDSSPTKAFVARLKPKLDKVFVFDYTAR